MSQGLLDTRRGIGFKHLMGSSSVSGNTSHISVDVVGPAKFVSCVPRVC